MTLLTDLRRLYHRASQLTHEGQPIISITVTPMVAAGMFKEAAQWDLSPSADVGTMTKFMGIEIKVSASPDNQDAPLSPIVASVPQAKL
jgi:hypothetical protein